MLSFIKNKQGNITIISILLISFCLILSLSINALFLENYHYYQSYYHHYNLNLVENLIVKNIYDDYTNVSYQSNEFSYQSIIIDGESPLIKVYTITVLINNDMYKYHALYDVECNVVREFIKIETIFQN